MRARSYRLLLAGTWLLACAIVTPPQVALGQSGVNLAPPAQVLLYLHAGLKDTDFVEPLVCALKRVLVAPVDTQTLDLSLGPELLASPTQFDVAKVAGKFIQTTATAGVSNMFKYFLIPYDMKDGTY